MILIVFWYTLCCHRILSSLVLVSISISILLQDYCKPWFFLQSFPAYREKVGEINGRIEERPQRMRSREVASQCVKVRIFAFSDFVFWYSFHDNPWYANVACELAVAVTFLFKLEIWKTLGKPCLLINYCQTINGTRTVENKSQVIRPLNMPPILKLLAISTVWYILIMLIR